MILPIIAKSQFTCDYGVNTKLNSVNSTLTISSNSPICSGGALVLSANTSEEGFFMWTGPNGYTSNQQNPVIMNITSELAGTYILNFTNSNGLIQTQEINIEVLQKPETPIIYLINENIQLGNNIEFYTDAVAIQYYWISPYGESIPTNTNYLTILPDNQNYIEGPWNLQIENTSCLSELSQPIYVDLPENTNIVNLLDNKLNTILTNENIFSKDKTFKSEANSILPKIATCSNGNSYISWYTANSETYSAYLQLIDSEGNKLWSNDLLVSNYPTDTWVTDYSLTVDNENNCIFAFNDYRNTSTEHDIVIYKISAEGEFLWINDFVTFEMPDTWDFFPHLVVTPQNNIVVCWTNYDNVILLQKLSPTGEKLWGENPIIIDDVNELVRYGNPQIFNAGDENIFLAWTYESGNFMYPDKNIYLQKIDENGELLFENNVVVYNGNDIPVYSSFIANTDNENGIYFSWYAFVNGQLNTIINHVDNVGIVTMTEGGFIFENNQNFLRLNSAITVNEQNEMTVFWKQTDLNQTVNAIFGQKFNETGEKLLGENSVEIIPMASNQFLYFELITANNQTIFILEKFLENSSINVEINSYCFDQNSDLIWSKTVSDFESEKTDVVANKNSENQTIIAWADLRNSEQNIFIQNIFTYNLDLGNDTTITTNQVLTLDAGVGYSTFLWQDNSEEQTFLVNPQNYELGINTFNVTATDNCDFEYSDEIEVEIILGNEIDRLQISVLQLFPNPATDIIYIKVPKIIGNNYNIMVYDISGKNIITEEKSNYQDFLKLNASKLNNGIYFIKIENNSAQFSGKILIKK